MRLPNHPITQSPNHPPVVFFGSSSYVLPVIEVLQENFDLKLVITTEKSEGAVPTYCVQNKIPYLSVSNFSDPNLKSLILNLKSPIAVLADFGLIIPDKILSIFSKGIINIHPSLLPKYRGPTPVQTAILNGEKITGVSIMKVDNEIDHGPILKQEKEEILDTDTSESLYKRLFTRGANLLPETLNAYLKGDLKPIAQNHKEATFTKPLTRQDGYIEISNLKSQISKTKLEIENWKLEIARMIRAYFPWPGVWTKWKMENEKWKILKFLPNKKLQVAGKKPVSYKDFINGYPEVKQQLEKLLGQVA